MFKKFICSALIIIALLSVSVSAVDLPDYDLGLPEGYEWFEFISGSKQKEYLLTSNNANCFYTYVNSNGSTFTRTYSDSQTLLDSQYNYPVVHFNKGLVVGNTCKSVMLNMFTVSNRFSYVDKLFVDFYVSGYGYNQSASLYIKKSDGTNRSVPLSVNGTPVDGYDEYDQYYVVYRFTGLIDIDAASDDYLLYLQIKPWTDLNHQVTADTVNSNTYWVQFNTIYYTPRTGYNGNVVQIIQGQQDIINGIGQASDDIQNSIESSADRIDQSIQDASDDIQNSIESGVNDIINMPGVEFVEPEGADSEEYLLSEFDEVISGFSATDLSWMDVSIPGSLSRALEFVGSKILVPIFSSTPVKSIIHCVLPIMLFLLAIGSLTSVGSSLSHVERSSARSSMSNLSANYYKSGIKAHNSQQRYYDRR